MQPPYAARSTDFQRDANNGLDSPSPAGVDGELNSILNSLNQAILRIRGITEADGTLINFAAATAQALAGTQDFTATAAQSVYLTTIAWTAAFTSSNVFVYIAGLKLATSAVTVANSGGFLQVTITAQSVGTVVTVVAFESGAGLLSRLQTISATEGASLIAINDAGGFFTAVTIEGALQEEATARIALATAVGTTADLIRRTGTVAFTAAQSMGGFKLTNLANGTASTDAVTVGQLNAYTAVWNALQSYFLRLDGTIPMGGALQMGANKITGLAPGTVSTDAVNKAQLDLKANLSGGTYTGDLNMGGFKITNLANPIAETDAINLATARTLSTGLTTRQQFATAVTATPWVVPAGVARAKVRMWGGGGGGGSGNATTFYGGGSGAYAEATLAVTAGESLTITVGAGGAAGVVGGDTIVQRGATVLMRANGGVQGSSTGLGGSYTFDASVTGLGINGGVGSTAIQNTGATDPVGHPVGNGGSAPCGGGGGRSQVLLNGGTIGTATAGEAPGGGGCGYWSGGTAGAAGRVEIEY